MRRLLAAVICVLCGCTTFEDPAIVLDLRVLAMTAVVHPGAATGVPTVSGNPGPEQVIDVDLEHPQVQEILAQLQWTTVAAFVSDPGVHRPLRWAMTLCLLTLEDRCDTDHPVQPLGSGLIDDPDDSLAPQRPNAEVIPSQLLLAMLSEQLNDNPVQALGGVEYGVVIDVDDPTNPGVSAYAAKHLRIAGRVPKTREANLNPGITYLDAAVMGAGLTVEQCRCADVDAPVPFHCAPGEVIAGDTVTLFPVEPDSTREVYTTPTLTGEAATLTETVTYQWLSTQGSFSDETTGGGHDLLGNQSLLGTEWRSPRVREVTDVPIWMIQRDERYGANVWEVCIRVLPK